jgi:uncharacterized membrane protein YgdD (TMEM256/DUF423 family)
MQRLLAFLGGLAGAAGVALMAAGSHGAGSAHTSLAGSMTLMHAPALLAIGLLPSSGRLLAYPGLALFAGVALFGGDLVCRDALGHALFPYAAPIGGTLLILAWLGIAVAALLPRPPSRPSAGGMRS